MRIIVYVCAPMRVQMSYSVLEKTALAMDLNLAKCASHQKAVETETVIVLLAII